jgi:hypothetical protein
VDPLVEALRTNKLRSWNKGSVFWTLKRKPLTFTLKVMSK